MAQALQLALLAETFKFGQSNYGSVILRKRSTLGLRGVVR